jgi:hypothetical protein
VIALPAMLHPVALASAPTPLDALVRVPVRPPR